MLHGRKGKDEDECKPVPACNETTGRLRNDDSHVLRWCWQQSGQSAVGLHRTPGQTSQKVASATGSREGGTDREHLAGGGGGGEEGPSGWVHPPHSQPGPAPPRAASLDLTPRVFLVSCGLLPRAPSCPMLQVSGLLLFHHIPTQAPSLPTSLFLIECCILWWVQELPRGPHASGPGLS